jgi:uncharacterized RDD family membrane protein YckC
VYCTACGTPIQPDALACSSCGAAATIAAAAPPPLPPAVSAGGNGDIVYAGFLRRYVALFLDQLMVLVLILIPVLASGFRWNLFSEGYLEGLNTGQGLYDLFWLLIAPLYYAGTESSPLQATLGKRALGIKVSDSAGRRISFKQALIRWICALLSYLTLYIGFAMAAFTERKRALHDFIAHTVVVDRWAYTAHPERQQRSVTGGLVVAVIAILMTPVLALAIAFSTFDFPNDSGNAEQATRSPGRIFISGNSE